MALSMRVRIWTPSTCIEHLPAGRRCGSWGLDRTWFRQNLVSTKPNKADVQIGKGVAMTGPGRTGQPGWVPAGAGSGCVLGRVS